MRLPALLISGPCAIQLPETFRREKPVCQMQNCPDVILAIVFRQNSPGTASSYVSEGQM